MKYIYLLSFLKDVKTFQEVENSVQQTFRNFFPEVAVRIENNEIIDPSHDVLGLRRRLRRGRDVRGPHV